MVFFKRQQRSAKLLGIFERSSTKQETPELPLECAFNIERIPGKGEDADPLLVDLPQNAKLLGVFDGMGGAGSMVYDTDGNPRTGAYLASRLVRSTVNEFFRAYTKDHTFEPNQVCKALRSLLASRLQKEATELDATPSKLKSKLIKQLPTTLAIAYIDVHGTSADVHSLWAGDSRCYALDPSSGLHQLSLDDLKSGGDALENLKSDSLLSNCVNAEDDFVLNVQSVSIGLPCIVLVASDGCFGYLFTPAHFEYLLLNAITCSTSVDQLKSHLVRVLEEVAGDDASLALVCLGWTSYSDLCNSFKDRHSRLHAEFITPVDDLRTELNKVIAESHTIESRRQQIQMQLDTLRDNLWHEYKLTYSALLPMTANANDPYLQSATTTDNNRTSHPGTKELGTTKAIAQDE